MTEKKKVKQPLKQAVKPTTKPSQFTDVEAVRRAVAAAVADSEIKIQSALLVLAGQIEGLRQSIYDTEVDCTRLRLWRIGVDERLNRVPWWRRWFA